MRARIIAAVAVAAALAVLASTASGGTSRQAAETVTVWLQLDAQQAWPNVVTAATDDFKARHPGVNVKVEFQTWGEHLTKLDAAIAGGNAPDVVEMGNSEMTKYMAAGAFAPLNASTFENSSTWLKSLKDAGTYNGKLYGVPYYAGARAVIYRSDYFKKAGVTKVPTSLAEYVANGKKVMDAYKDDKQFSALYFPGKYWYAALSFVYDYGGKIATTSKGKWVGTLNTKRSLAGLAKWKETVLALSRASKTTDEANPWGFTVFPQGKVASYIGNGWEWGSIIDPKNGDPKLKPVLNAYPMPSHTPGKYMPTFLGGSNLAVTAASKNQALAADWIKSFTSAKSMSQLATVGKVIPNNAAQAGIHANNKQLAPFAKAATSSWFVPTAKNWANVESSNVLQDMLVAILTGDLTVREAAARASQRITSILNT